MLQSFAPSRANPTESGSQGSAVVRLVIASLLLLFTKAGMAAPKYVEPDQRATRAVAAHLYSNDCPGAVAALKDGIKAKQRDVLLLAGWMYENGTCVKQNWEKAVNLYQLADAAGNPSAIPRLAAGFAAAGRENGVALWWAAQYRDPAPSSCIPAVDPNKDLDGFNAALERMPPALFKACVYMTGVYFELLAEARFPPDAQRNGVSGDVDMEFNPSKGTIEWRQGRLEVGQAGGVRDIGKTQFDDRRPLIENSLMTYLKGKGELALARYQKPEGIDPGTRMKQRFTFEFR